MILLYLNTKIAATSSVTLCLSTSAASKVSVNVYPCFKRTGMVRFSPLLFGWGHKTGAETGLEPCPCSRDSMKNIARESAQILCQKQFRNEPRKQPGEEQQGTWSHSPKGDSWAVLFNTKKIATEGNERNGELQTCINTLWRILHATWWF